MHQPTPRRARPLRWAGWLFVSLGLVELTAGLLFNPALLLIAVHDLAGDGLPFLLYDLADQRLEQSHRHFYNCLSRKLLNALIPPLATSWAVAAFILEPASSGSLKGCLVTVSVAIVNFGGNRLGHKWLHEGHDDHHHSVKLDLLVDMLCAPLAALASIMAFAFQSATYNEAASWIILALMAVMMTHAELKAVELLIRHKQYHPA